MAPIARQLTHCSSNEDWSWIIKKNVWQTLQHAIEMELYGWKVGIKCSFKDEVI